MIIGKYVQCYCCLLWNVAAVLFWNIFNLQLKSEAQLGDIKIDEIAKTAFLTLFPSGVILYSAEQEFYIWL